MSHLKILPLLLAAAILLGLPAGAGAADEGATATEAPETHEVVPGRFAVTLELAGTFVPRRAHEVMYEPEEYGGPLEVRHAVAPGRVTEGQLLVSFDREAIDEEVHRRERDLEIARLKLAEAEEKHRRKEEDVRIALDQSELRLDRAVQELELFRRVNRPSRIEQSEYGLEGSEIRIQDTIEELEQLERMYGADELTEETEEIVLRRTRRGLERQRRSLGFARQRHELLVEVTLPREEQDLELNVRKYENAHGELQVVSDLELKQARLEMEARRETFERQAEALEGLRRDREAMDLRAPADGWAVAGFYRDGKWQRVAETERQLEPGGTVKAGQVLFTVVNPGEVDLVAGAEQKDLLALRVGASATAWPSIAEGEPLAASVDAVAPVPVGGKHEVRVRLSETHRRLMPGQTARIAVVLSEEAAALTVPAAAVAEADGTHRVWVWTGEAAEARTVEVGATHDGVTVVVSGVSAGDHVLVKAPEDK
jgi:RND family efflux transporter MFP subunit